MRLLQSKIFAVLALLAIAGLAWSLLRLWPRKIIVENRLKNLEQKIAETEQSNSALARLLDYFKSPAYLEREAKLKLNVRKPDENVVFMYRPDADIEISAMGHSFNKQDNFGAGTTNFEKWMRYLFKRD